MSRKTSTARCSLGSAAMQLTIRSTSKWTRADSSVEDGCGEGETGARNAKRDLRMHSWRTI